MRINRLALILSISLVATTSPAQEQQAIPVDTVELPADSSAESLPIDARTIIKGAMDNWRGVTSYSEMTMTIQRPEWVRSMSMRAWTEGEKKSLVRVTKPKRDAGNASLINDKNMWSFAPKINRVIKVPSSMMSQSWMGSDFSNKDISRSTEILDNYDHSLSNTTQGDGHSFYTITAVPHEDAPVVWGKEVLIIRDDFVLMEQQYWDQDGELVKVMKTISVMMMDGRSVGETLRMYKVDTPDEWTEVTNHLVDFDVELSAGIFTLSNLRNPRE